MLGFAIFINFKFLVVDVDPIALESHAITRSIQYRVAWSQFQPFLIITMVAASAGLDSLLTEHLLTSDPVSTMEEIEAAEVSASRMVFGRCNAYFSTAFFYLALVFQRVMLNLPPAHIEEHAELMRDRALGNYMQSIVAVCLIIYPLVTPINTWPLNLGDIIVIAASASGLVAMHLYLKQRELETLDKHHELASSHTITNATIVSSHQQNDTAFSKLQEEASGSSDAGELEALNKSSDGTNWEASCNVTNFDDAPL